MCAHTNKCNQKKPFYQNFIVLTSSSKGFLVHHPNCKCQTQARDFRQKHLILCHALCPCLSLPQANSWFSLQNCLLLIYFLIGRSQVAQAGFKFTLRRRMTLTFDSATSIFQVLEFHVPLWSVPLQSVTLWYPLLFSAVICAVICASEPFP